MKFLLSLGVAIAVVWRAQVYKLHAASRILSARPLVPALGISVTVLSTFILNKKVLVLNSEADSTVAHEYG
jgi:hypothetical protein